MIARQVLSVMFVFALIGAVPAVSFADTVSDTSTDSRAKHS